VPLSVDHIEDCPDLGPRCAGPVKPTPYWHHVKELVAETALDATLGITPYFSVEARWSLQITDVSPTYSELDGTPKLVPNDIHHHDETLVDVTDPWLLAQLAGVKGNLVSVARLGLSLPVGRTVPDPYVLGREGKSHEHVQSGTGTFVPIVGFAAAYAVAPVTIGLGGMAFFNLSTNEHGYRAPARLFVDHRVSVSLLGGRVTPFVDATFSHAGEEYWHDVMGLEGTTVRTEIYLGGGVDWAFRRRWNVEASVRGRVASLTDAATFSSPGVFGLALWTTFPLWGAETKAPTRIRETRHDSVVEFEKE
jgi:hypothetical protein